VTGVGSAGSAPIHIGVGGWDFDPWRETFYPAGLPRTKQLEHASRVLGAIEINATFYRLQKRETWERWATIVPKDFRFAIKASRFSTNRKNLGDAAEAIGRFCAQGFTALGDKLGPILWQLAPTKKFDSREMRDFFALLPTSRDGLTLRHAIEVRHESFACREFVAMAGASGIAICIADSEDYPCIADLSADFVYVRLRRSKEEEPNGYSEPDLDRWAEAAGQWSTGRYPAKLPYVSDARPPVQPREVFLFVISGAKARNPAAARALIDRVAK